MLQVLNNMLNMMLYFDMLLYHVDDVDICLERVDEVDMKVEHVDDIDTLCVPCMSMQHTHFASLIKSLKIQINFYGQAQSVQ